MSPTTSNVVIGGRYALLEEIRTHPYTGTSVWKGRDVASGRPVAVKRIPLRSAEGELRARREVAALLRLARFDGVVAVLDDAVEAGDHVIVMELVDGRPFPGPLPDGWASLAPRLVALLRAVAGFHAAGVVHRDLKPDNVLVAGDEVTVLDFGVARGEPLGATLTGIGGLLGTVAYLAPEQASTPSVDARADLYAIGVMVFHALTGEYPIEGRDDLDTLRRKTVEEAPLLDEVRHELPPGVPALIASLLARDRDQRPVSAADVLRRLGSLGGPVRLPWLGPTDAVDEAVARLLAGGIVRVDGPPGSGRSRFVDEAIARLGDRGVGVTRLSPGEGALESLVAWLGSEGAEAGLAHAEAVVRGRLAAGDTLVADPLDRIDRWSRRLLERAEHGPILLVSPGAGSIVLRPLAPDDLRPLFAGSDRVFHIPEDAAALLHARTGGLPRRVVREVDAWVGSGVARWEDDRLAIDRLGLERVASGLVAGHAPAARPALPRPQADLLNWLALAGEVHPEMLRTLTGLPGWELDIYLEDFLATGLAQALPDRRVRAAIAVDVGSDWSEEQVYGARAALVRVLPRGAPGRLGHLLALDDALGFAEEALHRARTWMDAGRTTPAIAPLSLALARLREDTDSGLLQRLAEELARAALLDGAADTAAAAEAELNRSGGPAGAQLAILLRAWARLERNKGEEAVEIVREFQPWPDEEIDAFRLLIHVRHALLKAPKDAEDLLEAVPGGDDPATFIGRRRREWLGQVRREQGRASEAADLFRSVARSEPVPLRRLSAQLNAARVLLTADEPEQAEGLFATALAGAVALRTPRLELFAWCGLRSARYRLGREEEPDPDLPPAAALLQIPRVQAELAMTDAAVAWRRGRFDEARRWARTAADAWAAAGYERGVVLARAIAAASGSEEIPPDAIASRVRHLGPPLLRLQVLALLASVGASINALEPEDLTIVASELRQAVLAPAEALSYLRGSRRSV